MSGIAAHNGRYHRHSIARYYLHVVTLLVPITYQHNDMETLEELPRDTFSTAQVSTKIIRFEYG